MPGTKLVSLVYPTVLAPLCCINKCPHGLRCQRLTPFSHYVSAVDYWPQICSDPLHSMTQVDRVANL